MFPMRWVPVTVLSVACSGATGGASEEGDIPVVVVSKPTSLVGTLGEACQRFYERWPDDYETLVLWGSPGTFGGFLHLPVRNGTVDRALVEPPELSGRPEEVHTTAGLVSIPARRLAGVVWMGSTWPSLPDHGPRRATLGVLAHETAHRWGARLGFRNRAGERDDRLLRRDHQHWSYLLAGGSSPLGGNEWTPAGGRRFRAGAWSEIRYSPLDLYLMGLVDSHDVAPLHLLTNVRSSLCDSDEDCAETLHSESEIVVEAGVESIVIEQVDGVPSSVLQSDLRRLRLHRQAWAYVVVAHETPDPSQLSRLSALRAPWEQTFHMATGRRGSLITGPRHGASP